MSSAFEMELCINQATPRKTIGSTFIPFHHSTVYGCFLKWWYPKTIGFPSKNDHYGVFWVYHHFRKHPYSISITKTDYKIGKEKSTISSLNPEANPEF